LSAESPFAGLTLDLPLSFYRETCLSRFQDGRLAELEVLGHVHHAAVRCPPHAFIPLVLGYRSFEEQQAAYPDLTVVRPWRLLMDTLFPKVSSFLYDIY
jgi:hypothetical protein